MKLFDGLIDWKTFKQKTGPISPHWLGYCTVQEEEDQRQNSHESPTDRGTPASKGKGIHDASEVANKKHMAEKQPHRGDVVLGSEIRRAWWPNQGVDYMQELIPVPLTKSSDLEDLVSGTFSEWHGY